MKKEKNNELKRLSLKKEVISSLNKSHLSQIGGGRVTTDTCSPTTTAPTRELGCLTDYSCRPCVLITH